MRAAVPVAIALLFLLALTFAGVVLAVMQAIMEVFS